MGSKATPISAGMKSASDKQACKCGNCNSTWFSQRWQCPAEDHTGKQRKDTECIALPKDVIGRLLRSKGEILRNLKEVTTCNVRIDDRYDEHGEEKAMRTASISSREGDQMARQAAVQLCKRTLQILCEEGVEVDVATSKALAEADEQQEERRQVEGLEKAAQARAQEEELVSSVVASVGDLFSRDTIREALVKENWCVNRASDRLFNERCDAIDEPVKPVLNMQKLLAAAREAKAKARGGNDGSSAIDAQKSHDQTVEQPSKNVMMIRDVFAKFRAEEAAKAQK